MFDVRRFLAMPRRRRPTTDYDRAVAALEAGRPSEALALLDVVLAGDPVDAVRAAALNKRGVTLVALDRRNEAIAAFCAILALDDHNAAALVNLGNLLFEDGHAVDAVDYYEGAIRSDAAYVPAYRNMAVALRRLGRRREAVSALRTVVRLEVKRRR